MLDLVTSDYSALDNVQIGASPHTGVPGTSSSSLALWPVPANDRLFLSGSNGNVTWSIRDVGGAVLMQGSRMDPQGLKIEGLAAGLYVFCAVVEGGQFAARFVKR